MKDTVDSLANDVKIYSEALITVLENKCHLESFDYVQDIQRCLKTIQVS